MKIYIDVSNTSNSKDNTGIQRVVRNISKNLCMNHFIELIALSENGIHYTCNRFKERLLDLPPKSLGENKKVQFNIGDVYFLIDSNWNEQVENIESLKFLLDNGVCVISIIHDLIPVTHPQYCGKEFTSSFKKWANKLESFVYGALCVSEYTLNTVKAVLNWEKPLKTFYLGCDIDIFERYNSSTSMPAGKNVLMVSSIEPKKCHSVSLDAFDCFWKQNPDVSMNLIIIGRYGWGVDDVKTRIETHPELGKRLFWYNNISDNELQYMYQNCSCVVCASDIEGFGLATVEAACYGKPLMLRNREFFKEIAGSDALYFDGSEELCKILSGWNDGKLILPNPTNIKRVTWKQCAQCVLEHIINMRHDYIKEFLGKAV